MIADLAKWIVTHEITEKNNIVRAIVEFTAVQAEAGSTRYSHLLQRLVVPRVVAAQSFFLF